MIVIANLFIDILFMNPPLPMRTLGSMSLCNVADLIIQHLSIAHRETLADMVRLLHFVDHCHSVILDRDTAFSFGIF